MRRPAQTPGKKRSNMERDVEDIEAVAVPNPKKKKCISNDIELPEQAQKDKDDLENELEIQSQTRIMSRG